tara:strand:+ start:1850 stop:2104 length:255 start_codon:yes stop_codon:yes gene_type:complete
MKTIINDIYGNPVGEMDIPVIEADITKEWEVLRAKRNSLLGQTDVYGLSDRTMTDEMKQYRQQLRDLPANTTDPTNPTWPTLPS